MTTASAGAIDFDLPDELSADRPPEARGLARDQVRLLAATSRTVQHTRFDDLGRFLRRGDLIVVNTSATLAAALDAVRIGPEGRPEPVVVHVAADLGAGAWVVELRSAPDGSAPMLTAQPGDRIQLEDGAALTLLGPHGSRAVMPVDGRRKRLAKDAPAPDGQIRLWRAAGPQTEALHRLMQRHGRPIRYGYVDARWPLEAYQTVFAQDPGSAEMPSAARPFTDRLVTRLISRGVQFAPLTLHCGVSSLEAHEPPPAERFRIPDATADLVNHIRERGGRIIAAGTTVTRALESAVQPSGLVDAADGWTGLVLGPDRPARVVTGLITGLHAPGASHLLLLEAVAGRDLVARAYTVALEQHYLWHEFGDSSLLLP